MKTTNRGDVEQEQPALVGLGVDRDGADDAEDEGGQRAEAVGGDGRAGEPGPQLVRASSAPLGSP